ncbi:hypothetical protein [Olsenella profusa]|uniref:hypothetical protein n=1 Tax=Olsenella profusa TaxID=138595 RepID=UPI0009FEE605
MREGRPPPRPWHLHHRGDFRLWGRLKSGAGWICLDYTSQTKTAKSSASKTIDIDTLAQAVIRGDYGSGGECKRRLGSNYAAVQKHVNDLLK